MLKTLYRGARHVAGAGGRQRRPTRAGRAAAPAAPAAAPGRSRDNPAEATFLSRTRLNKPGSEKETWHVEFDLAGSGIDYTVGDSFGIFPDQRSGAGRCGDRGARRAAGFPDRRPHAARGADRRRVARRRRPTCCSSCISYITGGERRQKAKALAAGEDPDGDAATLDVLAAIEKFSRRAARPGSLHRGARSAAAAALFDRVLAQGRSRPRRAHASTPCATRSTSRTRLGVASTFLAERVEARRHAQGLCPEGARTSACPPIRRCRSS